MKTLITDRKQAVVEALDALAPQLKELALQIHAHPELGFQEFKAQAWLTERLVAAGFSVERGVGGLETAFHARYASGVAGPALALLAEYDALPELGHACGHNLIGTASVGAAVALQAAVPDLPGEVHVIGCPAEEGGGGKIIMAEHGVFDGLDAAMLCHPHNRNMTTRGGLAATRVRLKFYGTPSHASAAPTKGVSALDALIHTFVAINSLRQFIADGSRIHGIITHGGDAPNVVPAYAEALFLIRAENMPLLTNIKHRVLQCAQAQAEAVGARFEAEEGLVYAERVPNRVMADLFGQNLEHLGLSVGEPLRGLGSSDIGNVGLLCPIIHPFVQIVPEHVSNHTPEFAAAAGSEAGLTGMMTAAKALAMTVIDLAFNPAAMAAAKAEWETWREVRSN